jgi:aminoglycoside phosphotransferase family enzyme/predicted kinase
MTDPELAQAEVLAFLRDPATHGGVAPDEVRTHSARIFLAGDRAVKLKRAVRYDYLDFSTPDRRRAVLDRELALNRGMAPTIYDRVAAVTRGPDGRLRLEGDGPAVDHVLLMHRFPAGAELSAIAAAGRLDRPLAEALGSVVACYYAAAEPRAEDGAELIGEIVEELAHAFAGMTAELGAAAVSAYEAALRRAFAAAAARLSARGRAGRVRRCHGDLHLRNLVLIDGAPVPFDALEFDERLGTCDVAYDLAFLVMDMLHRGLAPQANATLASWLDVSGDTGALGPLPLFLSIRAAIRAMVAVQTRGGTGDARLVAEARAYLAEAAAFLSPAPARLVAVGGLSGSGKTTLARAIAPGIGPAPGAVHLRSDTERKAMHGVAPLTRLPPFAYTPEVSAEVYDRLIARAAAILGEGHGVVLDAAFLDPAQRARARACAAAAGVAFAGIWLAAPPEVLSSRIAARHNDASDADLAVLRQQLDRCPEPPAGWTVVDADGAVETVAARIREALPW